jgi:hypothetical protein
MIGYKLPVTLLFNTASGMKKYLEERKAPNTGYCWGFEIEFVDETHILFHVPVTEIVENVEKRDDGYRYIEDIALFINCASSLDFAWDRDRWLEIFQSPMVEVKGTSYMSFKLS